MAEPPVSDEAVKKATGRVWAEWRAAMDPWAGDLTHREIAKHLQDEHGLSGWWAQAVTGGWERMTGRREAGEMPGGFQATASRTIAADEALVRAAVTEPSVFAGWAPPGGMEITTAHPGKPVNARWLGPEGGRLVFHFEPAGEKTKLTLNHERLPDTAACARMKAAWRAALDGLRAKLES